MEEQKDILSSNKMEEFDKMNFAFFSEINMDQLINSPNVDMSQEI